MTVAALYVCPRGPYFELDGVDPWDELRDARGYQGKAPVVAHPPCNAWSRLRQFSNGHGKDCGPAAVEQVRRWGGVLEHPASSALFAHCGLPRPGDAPDLAGGYTVCVDQHAWGHRARKRTWLYVVGVPIQALPPVPLRLGEPTHTLGLYSGRDRSRCRREVSKRERIHTPPAFAAWLIEVARRAAV